MEARLDLDTAYDGIEAAIHMCRYGFVRGLCEGRRILDVACGVGYGSALMSRWGADHVTGLDLSASAIADAERLFASERTRFVCAEGERLSRFFEAGEFDLVVSFETIEHVADPQSFLGEVRKVLKPGGVIVMSCPNDWWHYPGEQEYNPFHQAKYRFEEFRSLAEEGLGPAGHWFLGTATAGFCNVPADRIPQCGEAEAQQKMLEGRAIPSLLLPAESGKAPRPENASYFIGVWGEAAPPPSAALLPYGMDAFNQGFFRTVSLAEVSRLKAQLVRVGAALVGPRRGDESVKGTPPGDTERKGGGHRYADLVIDALRCENDLLRERIEGLQADQAGFQSQIERQNGALRDAEAEMEVLLRQNAELEMVRRQNAELESLRLPAERYLRLRGFVPRPLLALLRYLRACVKAIRRSPS